jgi:hypothetical protein
MAVKFTDAGAEKIARATRKVLGTPDRRGFQRTPRTQRDMSFWAMITGNDITGQRYDFVRVAPDVASDKADFSIGKPPINYQIVSDQPDDGYAREANATRGVPTMTVVQLTYIGDDADGAPAYLFQYIAPQQEWGVPIHDHRSNDAGGLAFAIYHPGTALPQMPWVE